jgi:hypothetical protein
MRVTTQLLIGFITCFASLKAFTQTPFRTGNIVVARVGNGSTSLTGNAFPVYLDEYSPIGTLVQSILLPTATVGSNHMLTASGVDPTMGILNLSPDNRFLSLSGYDAAPNTTESIVINGSITPRTIGIIDANAVVNTSTSYLNALGYPTSAVTSNGTDIWSSYDVGPIRYSTIGANTFTDITTNTSQKRLTISQGQLYSSSSGGAISTVGSGLPTTGSQTLSLLPGFSTSAYSQVIFGDYDPGVPGVDVAYVSNQGSPALSKYSLVGGTWTLNGKIGSSSNFYTAVAVKFNGTSATIFAIRNPTVTEPTGGGELVTITDNSGYNPGANTFVGTPTVIATAANNTVFTGVALAPQPLSISLSTKIFLQGSYNSTLGRHKNVTTTWAGVLNANALNQPYNVAPFNYSGTESVTAGFFTADDGVTTDIVDWVLVELHDATIPSTIIARKACFIREDGKVVDLDGTSDPSFASVGANNYYIVIKHRNHLTIRSASTVFVNGAAPVLYDFTTAQSQAYQNGAITLNAAMKDVSGVFCMWGGNVNANNTVRYTGPQNDAIAILSELGADQALVKSNVYKGADVNMDGTVRYTGPNNDAIALLAVLSANQAAVITEHQ